MARVEASALIKRPVEAVFEFVTNPENDSLWQTGGVGDFEQTPEGPIRLGTTQKGVSQFLGQRAEWTTEVTEYEPNRKVTYDLAWGPIRAEQSAIFEPVEGGTRFTLVTEGEVGGFFKVAEPVAIRVIRRDIEASVANLKDILEAEA